MLSCSRSRILISETLEQQCADWLTQRAEVIWCHHEQTEQYQQLLGQIDGLVVRTYTVVDDAVLKKAPRLKVVGRAGVGIENIDLEACRNRGVTVVHTPAANTQAVVEYTIGLIFDALRSRHTLKQRVEPEKFHDLRLEPPGPQLDELSLGILGFGRIGTRVGRIAHTIGMNLLINDLHPEVDLRKTVEYPFEYVEKASLYRESDILTIHVDGRSSNRNLIAADALSRLKPHAVLINTSRGMVIDTAPLANWARSHPQAKAVIDVHEPEPPPPDYPLWNIPNVRLLPHTASRTRTAMMNRSWVVRDVLAVLEGKQPEYPAI